MHLQNSNQNINKHDEGRQLTFPFIGDDGKDNKNKDRQCSNRATNYPVQISRWRGWKICNYEKFKLKKKSN